MWESFINSYCRGKALWSRSRGAQRGNCKENAPRNSDHTVQQRANPTAESWHMKTPLLYQLTSFVPSAHLLLTHTDSLCLCLFHKASGIQNTEAVAGSSPVLHFVHCTLLKSTWHHLSHTEINTRYKKGFSVAGFPWMWHQWPTRLLSFNNWTDRDGWSRQPSLLISFQQEGSS